MYWVHPPHPVTVVNKGLIRDSLLKMFHDPGGDWHPGWGVDPRCIHVPLKDHPPFSWIMLDVPPFEYISWVLDVYPLTLRCIYP